MRMAVNDAGIACNMVDYINAHGTSTPMNDKVESLAIKTAFGEHTPNIWVSSTKSMTGHMLGSAGAIEAIFTAMAIQEGILPPNIGYKVSAGAIEAIFTAMAIQEGILPPNIGYKVPDEDCDLRLVTESMKKADIRYALSNSLGFGGHNATIVLGKYTG